MSTLARTGSRTTPDPTMLVIASTSVLALVLSAVSLVLSLDDDLDQQRVQDRLACLELPGPNDCGLDGR